MSDRERWEERHRAAVARPAASPFIARHVAAVAAVAAGARGALALEVACGSGRHAFILREHGFRTVAIDRAMAACRRVASEIPGVDAAVADACALPLRAAAFRLIVQTLFLERAIFPSLLDLLAPGGVLLAETFLIAQFEATGHPRREFCLAPGELAQLCTNSGAVRVLDAREGAVRAGGSAVHLASIAICKV